MVFPHLVPPGRHNRRPVSRPSRTRKNNRSTRQGTVIGNRKRWRQLLTGLVLLLGFSLLQYHNTGSVRWTNELFDYLSGSLQDYPTRPEAGWRQATEALQDLGGVKAGKPTPNFDLTGRVVNIADGDTVSLLDENNTQHKIRLYGIDTPERDQPYGQAARRALTRLINSNTVGVVVVETDSYGRQVGTLYSDGVNINQAMVVSGSAWWYRHYARNERELAAAELEARDERLGLWAAPDAVPPWEWRRQRR